MTLKPITGYGRLQ